jgi:hypothetical protein
VKNTMAIIGEARRRAAPVKGARAGWVTTDPLTAYDKGERDVAQLSALWMIHVENPAYSVSKETYRRGLAAKLFPEWAKQTSVPGTVLGVDTSTAAIGLGVAAVAGLAVLVLLAVAVSRR